MTVEHFTSQCHFPYADVRWLEFLLFDRGVGCPPPKPDGGGVAVEKVKHYRAAAEQLRHAADLRHLSLRVGPQLYFDERTMLVKERNLDELFMHVGVFSNIDDPQLEVANDI